jgi:formylglycine-generating enzyme required for sulfatase activity
MKHPLSGVLGASLWLVSAAYAQPGAKPDFRKEVAPIFEQQCLACHSGDKAAGGLSITSRQSLLDRRAVVPGNPSASKLYLLAALPAGRAGAMPPGGPPLTAAQLDVLKRWIAQGADWPAGLTLSSGATPAGPADEHATVQRIYERIQAHQREKAATGRYQVTIPNTTVSYSMAPIPAGDFEMGAPNADPHHKPDEQPVHKVHVDAFWMQTHEVTWDEYRLFMFANQAGEIAHKDDLVDAVSRPTRPYVEMSFGMGINGFPAISMTQHAANKYAEWLSAKTGEFYRLPTEAEWEYACRAGSTTPYFFGSDPAQLADYAWYSANSQGKYQQVATKKPNAWGLYDMLGNIMEWTLDQYGPYQAAAATNPWVTPKEPYPMSVRGGSWNDPADMLRCAARVGSDASWKQQDPQLPKSIWYETDAQWLGFRLVRPARIPTAEEMYRMWNNGVEHDEQ